MNKTIPSNDQSITNALSKAVLSTGADLINADLSSSCFRQNSCTDLNNPQATCTGSYKLVGYDRAQCNSDSVTHYFPNHLPRRVALADTTMSVEQLGAGDLL